MNPNDFKSRRPLALAVALALAAGGTHAATLTVTGNDDDPMAASCSLREALASITAGVATTRCSGSVNGAFGSNDTIVFAPGLANATITLTQGELGVTVPVTINGSGQTIDGATTSRIFNVNTAGALVASNLTLTNGYETANSGGAVYVGSGLSLTFSQVTINGSYTGLSGGAIFANGATVSLSDTNMTGNVAAGSGGAIRANSSTVTLSSNTNMTDNHANAYGGAIYVEGGSTTITDSAISNNVAGETGGGVSTYGNNTLSIVRSVVSGDTSANSGGVYVGLNSNATVSFTTISANTGDCSTKPYCAGGLFSYDSNLNVISSTIEGNHVQGAQNYMAGGVYLWKSTATFANSTITSNTAQGNDALAGGLWELHDAAGGGLTMINCSVTANTATSYLTAIANTATRYPLPAAGAHVAGGVVVGASSSYAGSLTLYNTIVSANIVPANSDILLGGGATAPISANSLLGTAANNAAFNAPTNNNIFSDAPLLGPLQNNGGPSMTMALLSGSPALRAGNPTLATFAATPLYYDQRGLNFARRFGDTVDIGAYEDQGDRIFASSLEAAP